MPTITLGCVSVCNYRKAVRRRIYDLTIAERNRQHLTAEVVDNVAGHTVVVESKRGRIVGRERPGSRNHVAEILERMDPVIGMRFRLPCFGYVVRRRVVVRDGRIGIGHRPQIPPQIPPLIVRQT